MIVLAIIYGVYAFLGFIGNLLVIAVVSIFRRFHQMRYFLLASLALSDFLFSMLIINLRAVVHGLEKWIFGTTWCHGTAYLSKVLHFSTVLHLCVVSYERYNAIVKNPLCYDGRITKKRAIINITILWVMPAVVSLGLFLGWSNYVYNPEIFACEQNWDLQTTLPLLIVTFLLPLGLIAFLNYRVLTVVRRLQNSLKIIPIQTEEQADSGNKMQDSQREQKDQDKDQKQRHQQHLEVLGRNENGETPKPLRIQPIQHIAALDTLKNNDNKQEGKRNATFQEELDEINNTMYQKKVSFRKNKISSESRCSSPIKKTEENRKSMQNRCKQQSETKQSLDEVEMGRLEHEYKNALVGSETQIHLSGNHQLPRRIASYVNKSFEDDNGFCKAKQNEEIPGKGTLDESQSKPRECLVTTKDKKSTNDGIGIMSTSQETPQASKPGAYLSEAEKIVRLPHDDSVPKIDQERKRLGKTQRRLAKLLKEGKAARDVMIIIGVFLLCYLPTWILGCFRAFGGEPSVEVILLAHCFYGATMIWNPIIYSLKKKEFRKAVKKLLKL